MKDHFLLKLLAILSFPILFYFVVSGFKTEERNSHVMHSPSENPNDKNFINMIFTDTYFGRPNPSDPRAIENNISNFRDSLHFNSIHVYGYGNFGGGFDEDISAYESYVSDLISDVNGAGLRGFWGRNKIEQLCYGQRLIYEVEGGNNGFCYQTRANNAITDSGRSVVHLIPSTSPSNDAKWLCKNIYENLQHGDLINFTQWDTMSWYVKPVMRINASDFNINSTKPVVAIYSKNYRGNIIDTLIIRVNNFRNSNSIYSGNYIENYRFINGGDDSIRISGSRENRDGLSYGMDDFWPEWKDSCKVDFEVWWFGEIEVWFDKLMVDDNWGHQLFHADSDIRNEMESRIIEETEAFTEIINAGNGSFYIDELCISQVPCAKRVYQIMKHTNQHARLNFATTNYFNIRSCKDNSIGHREILKIQAESFNPDIHEFHPIYIPNNLDTNELDLISLIIGSPIRKFTTSICKKGSLQIKVMKLE